MKNTTLEEYRTSGALQDIQAGAPFNPFNRGSYIRHTHLRPGWERVLAVLGLAFVLVTLVNLTVRSYWP